MSDEASKLKGLLWLIATVSLGLAFSFGLSPAIKAVPWRWEKGLSHSLAPVAPQKICHADAQTDALLAKLVTRLYPVESDDGRISIDVRIVNDQAVNAYAGLGGNIYINKGLLENAQSADEVAGVLAHEIEHVKRRHILQNMIVHFLTVGGIEAVFSGQASSRWLTSLLNMNFTRNQESEADEGGLKRLQTAHISNEGFKSFFKRMEDSPLAPLFLSDHPDNQKRYKMAETFDNQNTTPVMTGEEWDLLQHYCP